MSQVDTAHAWWSRLRHQGLLLSPVVMLERYANRPEPAHFSATNRLRDAYTRFVSTAEVRQGDAEIEQSAILAWVDALLDPYMGHRWGRLVRQGSIPESLTTVIRIGTRSETIRPHRVVYADANATVPALLVMADTSAQLGRGRGRTVYARFLELLRGTGHRLGLLTNGYQFRLVYAGLDFESWCEWEADRWFDDGEGTEELGGLRQLLSPEALKPIREGVSGLLDAVEESRKRQADLSSVLRENVRQAVEYLLEDVSAANRTNSNLFKTLVQLEYETPLTDAKAHEALHQATVRLVMRLVVCLFAESRQLLPVNDPIYSQAYGVRSLYERLEEAVRMEGGIHILFNHHTAWPRMMALFRLIYDGSAHGAFPLRAYGGILFRPGKQDDPDPVSRALYILEHAVPVVDATIHAVLRKLLRGPLPVLRGRQKTFVEGPVDYTDLRTEFIGLIYEGLLDYRVKRTDTEIGPQVFLNLGREPVLPLNRLEEMLANDRNGLKNLLTTLRKESVTAKVASEEEQEEAADEPGENQENSAEDGADEFEFEASAEEFIRGGDYLDAVESANRWAVAAVVLAGLVNRQKTKESDGEYQGRIEAEAKRLIKRVVATGEFYLVRAGNTRKGTGTFYTRPQLSVPTVHRSLEPLCYDRAEDGSLTPKLPEVILALKVCDPACGSASFLVAALHYLTEALYKSLCLHRHLDDPALAQRITLPLGRSRTNGDKENLVPFPPDDPHIGHRFEERIKALLRRHVVERCIYGVDINALAVEFARVSLWVETLDPELPFSFLDHKLKVGNSLVGCWLDRVEDYPLRAWEREGGDGKKGIRSLAIKTMLSDRIKPEMKEVIEGRFLGQNRLFGRSDISTPHVVAQIRKQYEQLHILSITDSEERERYYLDHVVGSEPLLRLKRAMDEWCAVWFWPGDPEAMSHAPTPFTFHLASESKDAVVARLAAEIQSFHWELEFPDVFTPERRGFDALIGNPPWDVMKPNSQEFFGDFDPLYRTYDKQAALHKQAEIFESIPTSLRQWEEYNARFRALANWAGKVSEPFDMLLARGKEGAVLSLAWEKHRRGRVGFADLKHPFRLQGSADLNSYKMFAEVFWNLMHHDGRLGVVLPTGIYSDFGTKDLRETLLFRGRLELLYAFQNEKKIFTAADHRFKQVAVFASKIQVDHLGAVEPENETDVVVIATKGGATKSFLTRFRMGVGDSPEAHEIPDDILRDMSAAMVMTPDDVRANSPKTLSLVELKSEHDLAIFRKIYAHSIRIGDKASGWEINYATEFHMTNDSKHFPPLEKWEAKGYRPDVFGRWIGPDGEVAIPLYQGAMIHHYNPSFQQFESGGGRVNHWRRSDLDRIEFRPKYLISQESAKELAPNALITRFAFRDISSSTNERTLLGTIVPGFPCGNTLPVLRSTNGNFEQIVILAASASSLVCDYICKIRMVGSHMNLFVLEDIPFLIRSDAASPSFDRICQSSCRLTFIHRRFATEWLKLKQIHSGLETHEWKQWWAITEADRLRLRVEIDALCADLYGLDPDDFDWIVRDDPTDPKGFYRVDRHFPFRERLTSLAAAAFRALKVGRWSAESAAGLSNDEFFELLGIPELTNSAAAHNVGLPGPLIEKRNGCHVWNPEAFPADDPRYGWTWDDCWNDAVALLGSKEAVDQYLAGEKSDSEDEEISDPFMKPINYKPQTTFRFEASTQRIESSDTELSTEKTEFQDNPLIEESEDSPFQLAALTEPRRAKKKEMVSQAPTTDRHVAVIVRMIDAHREASTTNTLGSVKAEKIAHLIESHLGFDLGRNPVRDAAGPVDFNHFKRLVCPRAKKTFVFDTEPRQGGEGAIFVPMNGFNKALKKSGNLLGDELDKVDALIGLFVNLKSKHAEAIATLYACWNDFLADGIDVDDDRIIADFYAWDESKKDFKREELISSLAWMRRLGFVPSGKAKRTRPLGGSSQQEAMDEPT
jgi:hypothetical protein